ncbi:Peroxiredoxin [Spirosoma fluviale]|uniref:Peroxiredoxin n=2 Tax=Spirosoma fluviale TaxID=1597977 RepID=A0A286GB48_9BACT|nr:Peroxiredoxin [Spirosoma fluviale]
MGSLNYFTRSVKSFRSYWNNQTPQPRIVERKSFKKITVYFKGLTGLGLVLLLFTQSKPVPPRLTVYTFLSTECPISQQYIRTLDKLYQRFNPSGVRFIAMFPLAGDSPQRIRQFRSEYGLPFAGRPDVGARLARQFRVRTTPEVVVMQANGTVRYQGAIDDWYISLGKPRPEVTNAYLQQALNALLANQVVVTARTEAVGCLLN